MVGPDGNAPSSIAYRASALLLSYEPVAESGGLAPQPAGPVQLLSKQRPRLGGFTLQKMAESSGPAPQAGRPGLISGQPPRFAALLSKNWRREEVMLPSGKHPPIPLQTGPSSSADFPSINWCPWQDSHLHYAAFEARPTDNLPTGAKLVPRPGLPPGLFRVRTAADYVLPSEAWSPRQELHLHDSA